MANQKTKDNAIILNIYDNDDNVVRTTEARLISLRFGVIRSLMELLNIDNVDNTMDLLKTVYEAWDEIKDILQKIFPDVSIEELDNTHIDELVPFLDAIKTGKVDRTLEYLAVPVAVIDATIRSFTENKEIEIVVPKI